MFTLGCLPGPLAADDPAHLLHNTGLYTQQVLLDQTHAQGTVPVVQRPVVQRPYELLVKGAMVLHLRRAGEGHAAGLV